MDIGAKFQITAGVVGQAQIDKLNESLQRTDKATQNVGVSARQTAAAMRTLPAQFTDIATQLAGGQSPFLVLLQQGGQIKDSFGGLRPAAQALLSLLTPTRLILGGIGVVLGVVGIAAKQGADEIEGLNRNLALSGGYAGQTQATYQRLKKELSDVAGVSAGTSRELLQASIASAAFGPNLLQPAVTAMARIQKLSGQSAADIVKDFASMRSGVAAWAAEHNKQYNYLTAAQYKYIKQLEDQGDKEAAMAANMDALNKAFKDRTVELGYLERAWVGVKNAASTAWDAMLGIGRPETIDEKIDAMQKKLQSMRDMRAFNDKVFGLIPNSEPTPKSKPEQDLEQQLARLQEEKLRSEAAARDRAARDAEEQKAIEKEKERPKLEAANAQLSIQIAKNASEARIGVLQQEQAKVDRLHDIGFLSEQEYADRTAQIKKDQINAQISLAEQERSIEQSRKYDNEADIIQQQARVAAINGRIADLRNQIKVTEIEAKGAAGKAAASASKEFETFQQNASKKIKELTIENDQAAAKLIADPIQQQRKELEAEIEKIKQKYAEIIIPIKLKLETASGDEADKLQKDIDDLTRERDRAIQIQKDSTVDKSSPFAGMKEGIKEIAAEVGDKAASMKKVLTGAFESASNALTDFVMTGKLNFGDFAKSVIRDLTSMIVKQLLFNSLKAGLGGTSFGAALGFKDGGAFGGGTQFFASGDVFSTATPFRFANGGTMHNGVLGEAGPEAVMPLKRGKDGRLGVAVQGGQSGGHVSIGSIVVQNNGDASAQDTDGKNSAALGRQLAAAVQAEIIKQKRPGGLLYAA